MSKGKVGEDRESKETDGCPLTSPRCQTDRPVTKAYRKMVSCSSSLTWQESFNPRDHRVVVSC
jgi:hypothetical protein